MGRNKLLLQIVKIDHVLHLMSDTLLGITHLFHGRGTTPRAPRKILRSRDKFADHFLKWLINFGEKKNILYFK